MLYEVITLLRNATLLIKEHISPSVLVVDGFYDPTPLEMELLGSLIGTAGVITSYSIHYTKLYDPVFIISEPGRAEPYSPVFFIDQAFRVKRT